MQKKRLIMIEKVMNYVFRAIDAFDAAKKQLDREYMLRKNSKSNKNQSSFTPKTVFVKAARVTVKNPKRKQTTNISLKNSKASFPEKTRVSSLSLDNATITNKS